jgi:hypothetical protein
MAAGRAYLVGSMARMMRRLISRSCRDWSLGQRVEDQAADPPEQMMAPSSVMRQSPLVPSTGRGRL